MAFVRVSIVDASGVVVPNAAHELEFTVSGHVEIAGVCNGDATDLRPMDGNVMAAFHGECVVYLRSVAGGSGASTLSAVSAGLTTASADFSVTQ